MIQQPASTSEPVVKHLGLHDCNAMPVVVNVRMWVCVIGLAQLFTVAISRIIRFCVPAW